MSNNQIQNNTKKMITYDKDTLNTQQLYDRQMVQFKVVLSFNEITTSIESRFIEYAKRHIMGKCHKEGFISFKYVKIIDYSSAVLQGNKAHFDVKYEFDICYPYEDMELYCEIESITKIGIKGIISKNKKRNPYIVFASRIHNPEAFASEDDQDVENQDENSYNIGDIIKVRVIGNKFEVNDPHISLLTKIVMN